MRTLLRILIKTLILVGQALMVVVAFGLANYLHYDGSFPSVLIEILPKMFLPVVVAKLFGFSLLKLFSGWWRHVSIHDVLTLLKANILGSLFFACYLSLTPYSFIYITPSILIIDGLLCFLAMSGTRVAVRLCREYFQIACKACSSETENVLIVGAGASGQTIVREIRQNPNVKWKVIGFVDQDKKRVKRRFQGVPVLATIDNLKGILRKESIGLVIIANPALGQKELRGIVSLCHNADVKSKILPNVGEILNGKLNIQQVRDVKLDDLLGREPADLDVRSIRKYLEGKRILVTGAAGSIGSEICRQVAGFGASTVVLFENAETQLFEIERNLKQQFPDVRFVPRLSDVRNAHQVNYAFDRFKPEVVFHAAAYKHVPMSELNPVAAIENNVLGSRNVADAADHFQIEQFVMISTDKAVNPTNIMGASKRAAEIYVQALARKSKTKIVTVRFGNVLGSNGSVVPIFQEQIKNGGPVTVTDPEATRFFMTIPEAVQLVLQAGSMGNGGEIFVLDMGEQIKIVHLAEELIKLSGMVPYRDIDIEFTGLRSGEKLHEELLYANEGVLKTQHQKICVAMACWHDLEDIEESFKALRVACQSMSRDRALTVLSMLVPEYMPDWQYSKEQRCRFKILKPSARKYVMHATEIA